MAWENGLSAGLEVTLGWPAIFLDPQPRFRVHSAAAGWWRIVGA